jgi:hypothetical protein
VVDDADYTSLATYALGSPGEVAGVETKGAEFAVTAASADEVDTLRADTRVGRLTAFLESSVRRDDGGSVVSLSRTDGISGYGTYRFLR